MAGSVHTPGQFEIEDVGPTVVRAGVAIGLLGAALLWTIATATPDDRIAVVVRFVHLVSAGTLVGGLGWQHLLVRQSAVTGDPARYRQAFDRFDRIAVPLAGAVLSTAPAVAGPSLAGPLGAAILATSAILAVVVLLIALGDADVSARHRGPAGIVGLVAGLVTLALAVTAGSSLGLGSLVATAAIFHVLALTALGGIVAWGTFVRASPDVGDEDPGANRRRWWFRSAAPIVVLVLTMTAGWQLIGAFVGTVGSPDGASLAAAPVDATAILGEIALCFALFALFGIGSRMVEPAS